MAHLHVAGSEKQTSVCVWVCVCVTGDGSLDGEDLSVIDEDLTSVTGMSEITGLPGVTTPSVLALSALSIGDGESHDNNTGDTTGVGAGGRSGYASNDPTARAAGAAGGRRSGESEGACERPLARDLCRCVHRQHCTQSKY